MSDVWVLVDDRVGSSNQAIALANLLGLDYSVKKLQYNVLAKLPNCFNLGLSILKNKKELVADQIQMPKLIIAAGRRSAPISLAFKKINPNLKCVHILKPEADIKKFDVVILPEHDKNNTYQGFSNIVYINGSITHISKSKLRHSADLWKKLIDEENYPKPYIGVLIGGDAKGCKFYLSHGKALAEKAINAARAEGASLLVTTSRRTPIAVTNLLKKLFREVRDVKIYFYDSRSGKENPYLGILGLSDYLIVTGDSINMCCEAIETGCPVFVYQEESMLSKKHQKFIDALISNRLIVRLEDKVFKFKHKSLSTSQIIKSSLKSIFD